MIGNMLPRYRSNEKTLSNPQNCNLLSFVICHWSFVIGHLSLVICHWSFVIGHLSLVICYCLPYPYNPLPIPHSPFPITPYPQRGPRVPHSPFPIPHSPFPP
ncbi:hypothetical protein FDUTEX481_00324 [Tolypothrix sp. PCC 7601]|nr:hypothetical protein FDUTEX481_00324 [Tolypothrix sp. PCC 7601]